MWSLFILGPALVSAVSSLVGLTGGSKFVIAVMGLDQWQRSKGFHSGEGILSPRDSIFPDGTTIDYKSEDDLSKSLGLLAGILPEEFGPFIGKGFDITYKEGELLRAIVRSPLLTAQTFFNSYGEDELTSEEMESFRSVLKTQVHPIIVFLTQFPSARSSNVKG